MPPRGIRNNNPGNIEYGPFTQARGAIGSDGRFAQFSTPEEGLAAMGDLLDSYSNRGLNTPRSIVGRWAPATENDVVAYAGAIARALGVGIDDTINLANPQTKATVIGAMVNVENGQNPYSVNTVLASLRASPSAPVPTMRPASMTNMGPPGIGPPTGPLVEPKQVATQQISAPPMPPMRPVNAPLPPARPMRSAPMTPTTPQVSMPTPMPTMRPTNVPTPTMRPPNVPIPSPRPDLMVQPRVATSAPVNIKPAVGAPGLGGFFAGPMSRNPELASMQVGAGLTSSPVGFGASMAQSPEARPSLRAGAQEPANQVPTLSGSMTLSPEARPSMREGARSPASGSSGVTGSWGGGATGGWSSMTNNGPPGIGAISSPAVAAAVSKGLPSTPGVSFGKPTVSDLSWAAPTVDMAAQWAGVAPSIPTPTMRPATMTNMGPPGIGPTGSPTGGGGAQGGGISGGSIGGGFTGSRQSERESEIGSAEPVSSGDTEGTVLCTYFMRKGWLPKYIWATDMRFSETLPSPMTAGYRMWACPLVERMEGGQRVLEAVLWPIVKAWSNYAAWRMGINDRFPLSGFIVHQVLGRYSSFLGRHIEERAFT